MTFFSVLRERETLMSKRNIGCFLVYALTRDGTHNLGMCPNQELNLRCFDLWVNATNN